MTTAPLTPTEDPEPSEPSQKTTSTPTIPYSESFENDLMKTILYPPATPTTPSYPKSPLPSPTPQTPSLPIPLKSPLRTHQSPIPGLLLTAPHGSATGGTGPSPTTISAFAKSFIESHSVTTAAELQKAVNEAVKIKTAELRDRMVKREEAVLSNERVKKEIKNLELDREAERRVEENLRREREGRAKRRV